jgi:hypothetical protein
MMIDCFMQCQKSWRRPLLSPLCCDTTLLALHGVLCDDFGRSIIMPVYENLQDVLVTAPADRSVGRAIIFASHTGKLGCATPAGK